MKKIIELIEREGYKYSDKDNYDDLEILIYTRGEYDYISVEVSQISGDVIGIFISSAYIDYKGNSGDESGVYLGEGSLPMTLEWLQKIFWILNNPVSHEIKLAENYLKHLKWISEELYPVLKHFGLRFYNGFIMRGRVFDEETPSINFYDEDDNKIYDFYINQITGDLEGALLDKYDIYGKLQFEIFCALENEFGEN